MIQLFNKTQSKIASIVVAFNAGARMEGSRKYNAGIAHMLEHCIFKGTHKRTCEEINDEVAMMGGSINAFTSHELVAYFLDIPYDKLEDGMELMSDIVLNSKIPEEEFLKEKNVVTEEEASCYDDISSFMYREFSQVFFKNYLSRPVIGTKESISRFTSDEVKKFYNEFCSQDQIILSVASNYKKKDIKELAQKYFGKPSGKVKKAYPKKSQFEYGGAESCLKLVKPGIEHSYVWLAFPSFGKDSEKKASVSMLTSILGGGMDSVLFKEVREKRGLVYSIYATTSEFQTAGAFMVCFSCKKDNVREVIDIVSEEVKNICEKEIDEKQLIKAKNKKRTAYLRTVEDGFTICMNNISTKLFGTDTLDKYDKSLQSVTIEDINNTAKEIFSHKPFAVICEGATND